MTSASEELQIPSWIPACLEIAVGADREVFLNADSEWSLFDSHPLPNVAAHVRQKMDVLAPYATKLRRRVDRADSTREELQICLGQFRAHIRDIREELPLPARWTYWFADAWGVLHWPDDQREYFRTTASELRHRFDYFLSFSRRGSDGGVVMRINRSHENFIRRVIAEHEVTQASNRENLLARAVETLLRERGLQGFYFPYSEGDNQPTVPKIVSAVQDSRIFVQLVQYEMFLGPAEDNMCFLEYMVARSKLPQRIFVHLDPPALRPASSTLVPADYDDWFEDVFQTIDVPFIDPQSAEALIPALEAHIRERVVAPVERGRERFILEAPS